SCVHYTNTLFILLNLLFSYTRIRHMRMISYSFLQTAPKCSFKMKTRNGGAVRWSK
ncbi:unnamed protein product, partial [Diamesa serratosioi]